MRCPNCNQENAESGSFCTACGTDLKAGPPDHERRDDAPTGAYSGEVSDTPAESARAAVGGVTGWFKETDDLAHGQSVLITARWILVGAGLILALWNPEAIGELRIQIGLILALAAANFFLHSQVLMGRPVIAPIVYAASAADIAVISLIVAAGGGFETGLFVFYFPAVLAFSVAFRTEATFTYTAAAIAIYGLISAADVSGDEGATLITRMVMLAAVAVCGHIYWRNERDRRRATEDIPESLRAEVRQGLQDS